MTVSCHWQLLQLRVLRFGFLQDGDVGIGVFPEGDEILIALAGFDRVALHGVSASQAEAGERSPGKVHYQSSVVAELLKFHCRGVAIVQHEISLPPQIDRAEEYSEGWGLAEFDRARCLQ